VLRSPPKYSFTKSKLRFWRLRKPCNWHFLNRHSYCENFCEFIDTHLLVSVHKVPFAALRLSENYSFTMSKLGIFGLRKPCK